MPNQDDEYQRRADEAKAWANKTAGPDNKAAWLRVAQGWLDLIKGKKPPKETDKE